MLRAQERQVASAEEAGRARAGEIPGRRGSRRSRANWRRGEDLAQTGDAEKISRTGEDTFRTPGKIPDKMEAGRARGRGRSRAGEADCAQTGDAEKISRELETQRSPAREL